MNKVMPPSRPELLQEHNRFPGGMAFLVLIAVSVALWVALIAFIL